MSCVICNSKVLIDETRIDHLRKKLEIGIKELRKGNSTKISIREELDQFFENIMSESSSGQ